MIVGEPIRHVAKTTDCDPILHHADRAGHSTVTFVNIRREDGNGVPPSGKLPRFFQHDPWRAAEAPGRRVEGDHLQDSECARHPTIVPVGSRSARSRRADSTRTRSIQRSRAAHGCSMGGYSTEAFTRAASAAARARAARVDGVVPQYPAFCGRHQLVYGLFRERPIDTWHPRAGLGLAVMPQNN